MGIVVNKAGWAVAATIGVFLLAVLTGIVRGGTLEPPGPPSPTDSVQLQGAAISSLPVTIDAPGRYYLTRNLSMSTSGNGITISASGVTLDLRGFQLSGTGLAGKAIAQADTNARYGWAIRNGTIVGWPGGGIHAPSVLETRLESLRVRDMQGDGTIAIDVGPVALLKDIVVRAAGGSAGIKTGPVARIEDCVVDFNGNLIGSGIVAGDQSSIERCSVTGYRIGIQAAWASDVRNCNVRSSSNVGISTGAFTTVKKCMVRIGGFGVNGIFAGGTQVVLTENTIVAGGAGATCIWSNSDYYQADGNVLVDCQYGLSGLSTSNVRVVRNKFSNVANPLLGGPSNGDVGPLVPAESTASPWANLSGF